MATLLTITPTTDSSVQVLNQEDGGDGFFELRYAQIITPPVGWSVSSVTVYGWREGILGNMAVGIYTLVGGFPDTLIGSEKIIDVSSLGNTPSNFNDIVVTFSSAIELSSGVSYAVVFQADGYWGVYPIDNYLYLKTGANNYSGGHIVYYDSNIPGWDTMPLIDFYMVVEGTQAVTPKATDPVPTNATTGQSLQLVQLSWSHEDA